MQDLPDTTASQEEFEQMLARLRMPMHPPTDPDHYATILEDRARMLTDARHTCSPTNAWLVYLEHLNAPATVKVATTTEQVTLNQ